MDPHDDTRGEHPGDAALDARLRAHFARLAPEEDAVDALVSLARRPGTTARRVVPRAVGLAIAASAIVLSSVLLYVTGSFGERTARVVREAAMNHNTRLSLEFDATTLAALNGAMDRLPFEIRRPDRVGADWRPVGGRYCSLAGHLAAHVKLAAPDGRSTASLFVTREAADLERLGGHHPGIDGVDVELWDEDGLFYAMARSAS